MSPRRLSVTARDIFGEVDDIFALDQESLDGEQHYRWVNDKYEPNLIGRLAEGYRPVHPSETGERLQQTFRTRDETDADELRVGDSVLMSIPKEVYEKRIAAISAYGEARLGEALDEPMQAVREAKSLGVRTDLINQSTTEVRGRGE